MSIDTIALLQQAYHSTFQTLDALSGSERFPHALLLEGESGWVMDMLVRYTIAKALCQDSSPPCMHCEHCRKVFERVHPDVHYMGENGEKSYTIDQVRSLRQSAFVFPNEAEYTVFVLENAETIPEKSQNALLKILEEPPHHIIFILPCQNSSQLLDTLLSRLMTVPLRHPSFAEGTSLLHQRCPQQTTEEILTALQASRGCVSTAYKILQGDNIAAKRALEIYDCLCHSQAYPLLQAIQSMEKSKEQKEALSYLKQLVVTKYCHALRDENSAFSLTPLQIMQIVAIIDEALGMLQQSINESLLTCYLTSKFTQAIQQF